mmetsp:Transcript_18597/g.35924  ORF Transcript_18597/g.35924 Transcript_18597/m.35924 type:complete len:153 (+) Transcript_18597:667-1125(+)
MWVLISRPSEADSMLRYALMDNEAPSGEDPAWILEEHSTSTRTNALYSLAKLRDRDLHSIVLVTSEFHQFRAARVFRVAALELAARLGDAKPIRVHVVDMSSISWGEQRERYLQGSLEGGVSYEMLLEEMLHHFNFARELAAIVYYFVRGWI